MPNNMWTVRKVSHKNECFRGEHFSGTVALLQHVETGNLKEMKIHGFNLSVQDMQNILDTGYEEGNYEWDN